VSSTWKPKGGGRESKIGAGKMFQSTKGRPLRPGEKGKERKKKPKRRKEGQGESGSLRERGETLKQGPEVEEGVPHQGGSPSPEGEEGIKTGTLQEKGRGLAHEETHITSHRGRRGKIGYRDLRRGGGSVLNSKNGGLAEQLWVRKGTIPNNCRNCSQLLERRRKRGGKKLPASKSGVQSRKRRSWVDERRGRSRFAKTKSGRKERNRQSQGCRKKKGVYSMKTK